MIELLIAILTPLLIGYLVIELFFPRIRDYSLALLKTCLGIGTGFGIVSCIFFVWSLVFGPTNKGFILVEILLLVFLILLNWKGFGKDKAINFPKLKSEKDQEALLKILKIVFGICLAFGITTFVLLTISDPHGSWDAWAIWNMRARFIFRGGDNWKSTFSSLIPWSHPDYPLLLPGLVARSWLLTGKETALVPIIISGLFSLAVVGLLVTSLFVCRSQALGLLGGIVLLGTPLFVRNTASQYADIPLSFYLLATFVLFFLFQQKLRKNPGLLILTGLMAGFSVWTKNEGLLFLFTFLFVYWIIFSIFKGPKTFGKELFLFLTGVLFGLMTLVCFKAKLVSQIETVLPQDRQIIFEKILDLSRYFQAIKTFGKQIIGFGKGVVGIVPLLFLYILLRGVKIDRKNLPTLATLTLTLGVILIGFFSFYIVTPRDLHWHLSTSLDRLLLQLWPSVLFVYFLIVSPHV